jgi:hypothetical protein
MGLRGDSSQAYGKSILLSSEGLKGRAREKDIGQSVLIRR